jgi:3-oxoadipate enol-lactonase
MTACEVNHRVEGREDGPPLVFVNSVGADLAMWDPQVADLGEELRMVRYDARGHGASPVPPGPYSLADLGGDLVALLDRLGIERASLCGVSLGGATAIWTAINHPERVERLLVCFSAARFGEPEAWHERAALVRAEGMEAVADATVGRWLTAATVAERPDLVARMREMIAATPAEGYASCCEALAGIDLRDQLGAIAAPTLVVSGSEDPATPPENGRFLALNIPGASFVELADAAHLGSYERHEAVDELIRSHLLGADREREGDR